MSGGRIRALAAALLAGGALLPMVALAGPVGGATVVVSNEAGAANPTIQYGTASTIALNARNTVIEWGNFNVAAQETIAFTHGTAGGPLTVINWIRNRATTINGSVTSAPDIAVWLVNPAGITFGKTGSFSGGSLVISTASITTAEFRAFAAGTATARLRLGITPVVLNAGSRINANGNVLVAAQRVTSRGTITAGGEVALVAASAVSVPFDIGSPLSIDVTAGTTLGSGSLTSSGDIVGGSIKLVASQPLIADLIQIPAGRLTATAIGGRVVIAEVTDPDPASRITVSSGPTSDGIVLGGTIPAGIGLGEQIRLLPGSGGIALTTTDPFALGLVATDADFLIGGSLTAPSLRIETLGTIDTQGIATTAPLGDIVLRSIGSGGNVRVSGALAAGGGIVLEALTGNPAGDGTVSLTGSAIAAKDIVLGAGALTLDTDLAAGGGIALEATAPGGAGIVSAAGRTISANSDGAGAEVLSLRSAAVIDLGAANVVGGTAGNPSAITVDAAGLVRLGSVTGFALRVGDLAHPVGALDLGAPIALVQDLTATSSGALTVNGGVTSGSGRIALRTTGAGSPITVSAPMTAAGDIAFVADAGTPQGSGLVTIGAPVTSGGALAVSGGALAIGADLGAAGALSLAAIDPGGNGIASGGTPTLAGNTDGSGGETVSLSSASTIALGGSVLRARTAANRAPVDLSAPGAVTLGTVEALILRNGALAQPASNAALLHLGGDLRFAGPVTLSQALLADTPGSITLDGALTVSGGGIGLLTTGTGTSVITNAALTASGDIALEARSSTGAVRVFAPVSAGGNYAQTGGIAELAGDLTATGRADLRATSGDLTVTGRISAAAIALTKRGTAGLLAVRAGMNAAGDIVLSSASDIELPTDSTNRRIVSTGGVIRLINTGTRATALGDGLATTGTFALGNAELGVLSAARLVIGDAQAVNGAAGTSPALRIGNLSLSSATGSTSVKLLTLGDIALSGRLSTPDPRTLQIGGTDAPSGDLTALATSFVATIDTGAAINAPTSAVDIRAARIVFAQTPLVQALLPLGAAQVGASYVSKPSSALYAGPGDGSTYLSASRLTLGYSNFAVFQNTGTYDIPAGAMLGTAAVGAGGEALRLYSSGDTGPNSFAMFGTVNGFTGNRVSLLPGSVISIADPVTGRLRIVQTSSRFNGCVIGAPDKGCSAADVSVADISLVGERGCDRHRTVNGQSCELVDDVGDDRMPLVTTIGTNNDSLASDIVEGGGH